MAANKFSVPNAQQEEILREMGMDPEAFVVRLAREDAVWLLHLKTRHEVMISINERRTKNGSK